MSTKVTTDIYLAAAFLALGAKLEKTDRTDPRHMEFHFSSPVVVHLENSVPLSDGTPKLDLNKLETDWVNKSLVINAFEFAEAIKRMKSIVHSR